METLLQHAQGLVYALLHLMPSSLSARQSQFSFRTVFRGAGTSLAPTLPDKISECVEPLSQSLRVVYPVGAANDSSPGIAADWTASAKLWQFPQSLD